MADGADLEDQLGQLVHCYTALCRAGAGFNFLHAKRLIQHWGPSIMPPTPPAFESEPEAIADVRAPTV